MTASFSIGLKILGLSAGAAVALGLGVCLVVDRAAIAEFQLEHIGASNYATEPKRQPPSQHYGLRTLDRSTFLRVLAGKPKAPVEIVFVEHDAEAKRLALQFQDVLRAASWSASEPVPASSEEIPRLANTYAVTAEDVLGVFLAIRAETQQEFELFSEREANTPLNALLEAILETLGSVNVHAADPAMFPTPPHGTLRIVVAPNNRFKQSIKTEPT